MIAASRPPSFWTQEKAVALQKTARAAGKRILAHRDDATENTSRKDDGSPVTAADHDSQRVIVESLSLLTPDIPVVAEEQGGRPPLDSGTPFWLVDPLDGTRNYVANGNEFTVNIALLAEGAPVVGIIYAPALDELFYGDANGVLYVKGCSQTFLSPSPPKKSGPPRLVTSRHDAKNLGLDRWQADGAIASWRPCSSAYKFGLLASGNYELYPRAGETCEWDIAAGDALLRALGGGVVNAEGEPMAYGKPDFINPSFLAYGPSYDKESMGEFLTPFSAGLAAGQ